MEVSTFVADKCAASGTELLLSRSFSLLFSFSLFSVLALSFSLYLYLPFCVLSSEAMGYLLKEALKTLCGSNQWSYAVFWKIGCQNPK